MSQFIDLRRRSCKNHNTIWLIWPVLSQSHDQLRPPPTPLAFLSQLREERLGVSEAKRPKRRQPQRREEGRASSSLPYLIESGPKRRRPQRRRGDTTCLSLYQVRHAMLRGNQIHNVNVWTLGIPKMYMGTL